MKLIPLRDLIIVKRDEETTKSAGGILLGHGAVEKPVRGKVVRVGPGKREHGEFVSTSLQPGDTVLFGKYTGTAVTEEGEDYLLMREEEVLARIAE